MPFPLAHPAAVLPLRRFCPQRLRFPALIIGSLSPDLAYLFGHLHLDLLSHRFLAGSFGFCLPAGLLVLTVFYFLRRTVVGVLPKSLQTTLLPLCSRSLGSPLALVVSLLIGAWTHILLDSITHGDGWLVERLPVLQGSVQGLGGGRLRVYDCLYYACTFAGAWWVTLAYLDWLDQACGPTVAGTPGTRWLWATLLAGSVLLISAASRGPNQYVGIIPAGAITILLMIGLVVLTARPATARPS